MILHRLADFPAALVRRVMAASITLCAKKLCARGAVGDTLGAPVEFLSRTEILRSFGPRGITEMAPAYGRIGAITADTQMTLFTAEGALRAHVRAVVRGICHPPVFFGGFPFSFLMSVSWISMALISDRIAMLILLLYIEFVKPLP